MRILHAHRIAGLGGSERHLLTLLPALADRGLDVSFVGLDLPGAGPEPFYSQLERLQIPFDRIPSPRDLSVRTGTTLRRVVEARNPDVLHTHLVHADAYGVATSGRTTLVSSKHNDDPFRAGPFRFVERLLTRRAARVICITEALARFNRDVVGLPAEKLRVVPYGMDAPPGAWRADHDIRIPEQARLLLAVGRLVPQKGLDTAIRALPVIRAAEPRAVLAVLGEGPERENLVGLSRALGVGDAVLLPGQLGDVAPWFERAELFVHPARWEGFGLVLLEAMLAAKAVVATAVSAVPEIVVDDVTGLLVPPDEPTAFARAVIELLEDPVRSAALGAAGCERAHTSFSVGRMTEATVAVYEEARG